MKNDLIDLTKLLIILFGIGVLVSCFTDDLWKMFVIPPAIVMLKIWDE